MTDAQLQHEIATSLGRIPSGLFVLTAAADDRRGGILASWVQQLGFDPPLVSVAVAKGRPILALITEARRFGLCQLAEGERGLLRRFASGTPLDQDPFVGLEMIAGERTGVPLLAGVLGYLECVVSSHVDVDGDHDLFVGKVVGAATLADARPSVHIRDNGLKY